MPSCLLYVQRELMYTYKNRHSYNLKEGCDHYGLRYVPQLESLIDEELDYFWNGIGSKGSWYNKLIPNTVYGLDISLASAPHDVGYHFGVSLVDKEIADADFLYNMYKIIEKDSCWLLKWVRKRRAYKYYLAVSMLGDSAFLNKNPANFKKY